MTSWTRDLGTAIKVLTNGLIETSTKDRVQIDPSLIGARVYMINGEIKTVSKGEDDPYKEEFKAAKEKEAAKAKAKEEEAKKRAQEAAIAAGNLLKLTADKGGEGGAK